MRRLGHDRSRMALLLLSVAFLVGLLWTASAFMVSATPGILYVSATDPTCGGQSPCYTSIQAAVDAAGDGDDVRVAAGTYTGTAPAIVNGNTYTQVVVITKSLGLMGGYSLADWDTPNLTANPTIIDAQRQGRAISIVGSGSEGVKMAGFLLTGGDYTGLGNPPGGTQVCPRTGGDCGGGLFARDVGLVVRDTLIWDNIASRTTAYSDGGGALLWNLRPGSLIGNTFFISNTTAGSDGVGGGLGIVWGGAITITNSYFRLNQANGEGGALQVFQPNGPVVIEDSTFDGNTAGDVGGALEARLTYQGSALRLNRVTMHANQGRNQGAAISLLKQGSGMTSVDMTNVLLAANVLANPATHRAVVNADGGSVGDLTLRMAHLTWADQPALAALRLDADAGQSITATLTNTLIVSATSAYVGSQVSGDLRIEHTNTLTQGVGALHTTEQGTPVFVAHNPLTGDPRLDIAYYLQPGSAAINAAVDAGVTRDIEGDPRPVGPLPDIGADEFIARIFLPVVIMGY